MDITEHEEEILQFIHSGIKDHHFIVFAPIVALGCQMVP